MGQGLTNREIADQLFVSEGTVKTHVKRILMKLHLHDRVHAVVFAYEAGLVRPREAERPRPAEHRDGTEQSSSPRHHAHARTGSRCRAVGPR